MEKNICDIAILYMVSRLQLYIYVNANDPSNAVLYKKLYWLYRKYISPLLFDHINSTMLTQNGILRSQGEISFNNANISYQYGDLYINCRHFKRKYNPI